MKTDVRDKKNIKFIIIIIFLFIIYMFFAFFLVNRKDDNVVNYLIIGDALIWQENSDKWYQLNDYNDRMNNNYWVYNDNDILKAQNVQYSNYKWYFFDENYNQVNNDNFRLTHSGKEKMKVANYQEENYESIDEDIISEVTKESDEEKVDLYRKSLKKIEYDFDNDGTTEVIYTFSDYVLDVMSYSPENYMVFTKNNKVVDVIKTDNNDILSFVEILDIDFDDQYEIVVSKGVINVPTFDSCYQIYEIGDNKLSQAQDCLYVE